MPAALYMAEEVGTMLGRSQVLFRRLQEEETSITPNTWAFSVANVCEGDTLCLCRTRVASSPRVAITHVQV